MASVGAGSVSNGCAICSLEWLRLEMVCGTPASDLSIGPLRTLHMTIPATKQPPQSYCNHTGHPFDASINPYGKPTDDQRQRKKKINWDQLYQSHIFLITQMSMNIDSPNVSNHIVYNMWFFINFEDNNWNNLWTFASSKHLTKGNYQLTAVCFYLMAKFLQSNGLYLKFDLHNTLTHTVQFDLQLY